MIEGQTNVRSSRFGGGAIDGIGKELGRFVVTTMDVPWQRAQARLGARPVAVLFVENMEIETLERQIAAARNVTPSSPSGAGRRLTSVNFSLGNAACAWFPRPRF